MLWPGRLASISQLLRDWGYQPTPTNPQYVSRRPGGALTVGTPDPKPPERASVPVLPDDVEAAMSAILDRITGGFAVGALDRRTALRAMAAAFDAGAAATDGWIVGNAAGDQWRAWGFAGSVWTPDRDKAVRYARREDAEAVHEHDEDAWRVVPYAKAREGA
jgi:hypothetical protein